MLVKKKINVGEHFNHVVEMLNFVFACDSLNYDFRELQEWATCRKIWIVQTGESYNAEYALLFNNFYSNLISQ